MQNIKEIINTTFGNSDDAQVQNYGKFIVIDGTDGSGKATQSQLLTQRLFNAGLQVELADFPQYNTKSAGLVEEYLSGKYGTPEEVGPYRASIFYACDRYDASFKIKKWLAEGKVVISNRYVTANMGHQGGKIDNKSERKAFFEWLYRIEYELFDIPKPDLNIILHVEANISQKLSQTRTKIDWAGKTNDIHQDDLNHLKNAEKVYSEIADSFPNFSLIKCTRDGQILTREEINDLIWREIIGVIAPLRKPFHAPNFKKLYEETINHSVDSADNLILKVEKLYPFAKLPTRAYDFDAGLDLYSCDYYSLLPGEKALVNTGIKLAIPEGRVGLIWDKSGLAKSGIHTMGGVIDAGYRGEIMVGLINLSHDIYNISPGQKIAQMLLQKIELPQIVETNIDDKTARNNGGFGSSSLF